MQNPYGATAALYSQPQSRPLSPDRVLKTLPGRARSEALSAVAALLVPWIVFSANLALLSFTLHYQHSQLCWLVVQMGACLVALCGVMAYLAVRAKRAGESARDPTWLLFIFASLALAWCFGAALGLTNYNAHMAKFYDVTSLSLYSDVDPAKTSGQQLLDAGRAVFAPGARPDPALAYGFRAAGATYCAAPVAAAGGAPLASYDFWAVGTDCCPPGPAADSAATSSSATPSSSSPAAFACGAARDARARAGARLLDEGQARYYKLAVEQVELAHGIRADHPLFFHWTVDPIAEVSSLQDSGLKFFLLASLTYFGLQLFVVVLMAVRQAGSFAK